MSWKTNLKLFKNKEQQLCHVHAKSNPQQTKKKNGKRTKRRFGMPIALGLKQPISFLMFGSCLGSNGKAHPETTGVG
jgi:hypothetical protein